MSLRAHILNFSPMYKFRNAVAPIKEEILWLIFMTIICTIKTGNFQVHKVITL